MVDIGALHCADKLTGIGRESLHISALTLGIDGIESQRRLTRTRESSDNDKRVARNGDIYILKVVHSGTRNLYKSL